MGIKMEKPPGEMNLTELAEHCRNEVSKYSRNEPHDDRYCLEIFRRAMLEGNAGAWEMVHVRFGETLRNWIRRHPSREAAMRYDSEENYIALALERFWRVTVRNHALEFHSLAAALSFLRACLNSAMIDTIRSFGRANIGPLPEPGFVGEPIAEEYDDGGEIWEAIITMLPGEREQRVAYLRFHCGLKPREIVRFCPQEFKDVQEIFRITRNIMERLNRNKNRLHWLLSDEE